ncbi:signal peptidase I [Isoptericola sp. NEAU-Y5]|uniref:Signal peptidase I n=1 Tax=Isoptericola luteus TaxID=2879484 RepID=A0ABS7ZJV0_9MICO|nr:signal peptidase I [Isoptericola sp. NEAU-Y5]MCA5895183.1 signal peptidase I [Isoptericola sp. NEAU-Y5]
MTDLDQRSATADAAVQAPVQAGAAGPGGSPRPVAARVGSILLTVVMVALVVLAAAVAVVPRLLGAVPLTVLSGSMEPVFSPGDLVVTQRVDPNEIQAGDLVTFQPVSDDPTLITHRVVGLQWDADGVTGFVTRGDANGADDDPIVADQVMGRVVYSVPLVGHVTNAGWGPAAATIGAVCLLVYGVGTLVFPDRNRKE